MMSTRWVIPGLFAVAWLAAATVAAREEPVSGGTPTFGEVLRAGEVGPVLVLVPCLGCDGRAWDEFMERNAGRYRMLAVTWPGMGTTELPEVTGSSEVLPYWSYVLEAMTTLLDQEAIESAVLVGHSAAGPYVVQYASLHPERIDGVVTVDATITNWDTFGYTRDERLKWAEREFEEVVARYDTDEAWDRLNRPPPLPDPGRAAFYRDMWMRPSRANVLAYWRDWLAADSGRLIGSFPKPLLALFGMRPADSDPEATKRERMARFQRAGAPKHVQVEFIADAGHSIWEWQPEAFDQAVATFVKSLTGAALWRTDIDYLARELERSHADLFHTISRERFLESVAALRERVPRLLRHQIIVELARIVASVGDGHTRLWLYPDDVNGFRRYPIFFYRFGEDLYVTAVDRRFAAAAGARLVRIGSLDAGEAFQRVAAVTQRDNPMTLNAYVPRYLAIPEVLEAVGIIESMEQAIYEVEDSAGQRHHLRMTPVSDDRLPSLRSRPMDPAVEASGMPLASARDRDPAKTSLYLRHPERTLWSEHLAADSALFVQINAIRNDDELTLAQQFTGAMESAEAHEVERLVLDLRHNGGGNNYLNFDLIGEIVRHDRLNQPGRLFVLIGRHTFSAAAHLVAQLELHTHAIFVGEPTGAAPNHYGDAPPIRLPHSGVVIRASSLYWQNTRPYPMEERVWTPPAVSAPPTLEAYRAGRDAALSAALAYVPQPRLSEQLAEAFENGGSPALSAAFGRFSGAPENRFAFLLDELLRASSLLRQRGEAVAALEVARLAAVRYPESPSAHESVGDCLRDLGDRSAAAASYRRMMEISPRGLAQARARLRLESLAGRN